MPYHAVCNKNMSIYSVTYAGRFIANHCCPMLNLYTVVFMSLISGLWLIPGIKVLCFFLSKGESKKILIKLVLILGFISMITTTKSVLFFRFLIISLRTCCDRLCKQLGPRSGL